jgi:hypothetical protein
MLASYNIDPDSPHGKRALAAHLGGEMLSLIAPDDRARFVGLFEDAFTLALVGVDLMIAVEAMAPRVPERSPLVSDYDEDFGDDFGFDSASAPAADFILDAPPPPWPVALGSDFDFDFDSLPPKPEAEAPKAKARYVDDHDFSSCPLSAPAPKGSKVGLMSRILRRWLIPLLPPQSASCR